MWTSPLKNYSYFLTDDSDSFSLCKKKFTSLPIFPHVGSFGAIRKFDIHTGVDLYCVEGTEVIAVEDGIVKNVGPFTGVLTNSPWWEDTDFVSVTGKTGTVVYGEIVSQLSPGQKIKQGQNMGYVKRVLRKDKGRPTSMLHLELIVNDKQVDPSLYLLHLCDK